jgi:ribonuclease HII
VKTKPHFELENALEGVVVGIDEVGCGPWAGPVVAAAAYINQAVIKPADLEAIHDSKLLKPHTREAIFLRIQNTPDIHYGVGEASVTEIDTLGLAAAVRLAMQRAVTCLNIPSLQHCLVDGIRSPQLPYPTTLVVKGDQQSISIALASIIAKVWRDKIMTALHESFPHYHWHRNAGYGTAHHSQAIEQHGITPHHRRSFAPIQKYLALKHD